jgi:hypothetical protein
LYHLFDYIFQNFIIILIFILFIYHLKVYYFHLYFNSNTLFVVDHYIYFIYCCSIIVFDKNVPSKH